MYRLSYGFRETRGYRIRSGPAGAVFYTLLDHSAVALILNNRKNVGLLAEWPAAAVRSGPTACSGAELAAQADLWLRDRPREAAGVRDAFLRDLSGLAEAARIPVLLAVSGLGESCPGQDGLRDEVIRAMSKTIEARRLRFLDLDAAIAARVGEAGVRALYGFAGSQGKGHLNVNGNLVYGAILADVARGLLQSAP